MTDTQTINCGVLEFTVSDRCDEYPSDSACKEFRTVAYYSYEDTTIPEFADPNSGQTIRQYFESYGYDKQPVHEYGMTRNRIYYENKDPEDPQDLRRNPEYSMFFEDDGQILSAQIYREWSFEQSYGQDAYDVGEMALYYLAADGTLTAASKVRERTFGYDSFDPADWENVGFGDDSSDSGSMGDAWDQLFDGASYIYVFATTTLATLSVLSL